MKEYRINEKQLELLKKISESQALGALKEAIKSADEMSTYLEMNADCAEERDLYESYLETWDGAHEQLRMIADNARELKYLVEDIENQPLETRKEQKTLFEVVGRSVSPIATCPWFSKYSDAFRAAGYRQPNSQCPRSNTSGFLLSCEDCWRRSAEPLEDADHAR